MIEHKIKTVSVKEHKTELDANPELCIIDVREVHEWQLQHIPDAIHIPKDDLIHCIKEKEPDIEKPIYLHCHAGMRSLYAANCLMELGYKEVYSVDGGILEWARAGYPIKD